MNHYSRNNELVVPSNYEIINLHIVIEPIIFLALYNCSSRIV